MSDALNLELLHEWKADANGVSVILARTVILLAITSQAGVERIQLCTQCSSRLSQAWAKLSDAQRPQPESLIILESDSLIILSTEHSSANRG